MDQIADNAPLTFTTEFAVVSPPNDDATLV
jgi:hypothetical protein